MKDNFQNSQSVRLHYRSMWQKPKSLPVNMKNDTNNDCPPIIDANLPGMDSTNHSIISRKYNLQNGSVPDTCHFLGYNA